MKQINRKRGPTQKIGQLLTMTTMVDTKPSQERWDSCRREGMNSSGTTPAVATTADRCKDVSPHQPACYVQRPQ